jgi:hypothetical protein
MNRFEERIKHTVDGLTTPATRLSTTMAELSNRIGLVTGAEPPENHLHLSAGVPRGLLPARQPSPAAEVSDSNDVAELKSLLREVLQSIERGASTSLTSGPAVSSAGVSVPRVEVVTAPPRQVVSVDMLRGMNNAARKIALNQHDEDELKDLCAAELRAWVADSPKEPTIDAKTHAALWKGILSDKAFAAVRRTELEEHYQWRRKGARRGKRAG